MPKPQLILRDTVDDKGNKRLPLKGAYAGTVTKGASIELTREQVEVIGQIILEQIREEIAEDTKKAGGYKGGPAPLPQTKRFADSFSFQVTGERTLEFTSDWPTARAHTVGSDKGIDLEGKNKGSTRPFHMTWLASPAVPYARIVQSDGKVVVVRTPNPGEGDALWVHPGFRRYSFLERGIRKGKIKALEALATDLIMQTISSSGLF